jgi:peptide/nickel transport system ATP-binding protein
MTVLKLVPMPPGRIVAGEVLWQGRDLVAASNDEMRRVRAKEIAIVFQEPMTSLNPVYSVGEQIAESLRLHEGMGRKAALERAIEMLALVRIPTPQQRVHDYPHQFSGGMRQRVMIAIALACNAAADRRRADDRARRDDPGADPRPARRAEGAPRHGDHADHACNGRRRRGRAARRSSCSRHGRRGGERQALFAHPRHPYTQG